jgi:hypothetical protein
MHLALAILGLLSNKESSPKAYPSLSLASSFSKLNSNLSNVFYKSISALFPFIIEGFFFIN